MRAFGGSFKGWSRDVIQSEKGNRKPFRKGRFSYGRQPSMAGHVYGARTASGRITDAGHSSSGLCAGRAAAIPTKNFSALRSRHLCLERVLFT